MHPGEHSNICACLERLWPHVCLGRLSQGLIVTYGFARCKGTLSFSDLAVSRKKVFQQHAQGIRLCNLAVSRNKVFQQQAQRIRLCNLAVSKKKALSLTCRRETL